MPAHTTAKQIGTKRRGDGKLLTAIDRTANEHADRLAKKGASLHRVPAATVDAWKEHFDMLKEREPSGLGEQPLQRIMASFFRSKIRKPRDGKPRRRQEHEE